MINPPSVPPSQRIDQTRAIQPAGPGEMTDGVVLLRPLAFEVGFGVAIVPLLTPKAPDRIAAVMPDDRRRAEAQCPPAVLQAPADVHVVAGDAESGVEPADRSQR